MRSDFIPYHFGPWSYVESQEGLKRNTDDADIRNVEPNVESQEGLKLRLAAVGLYNDVLYVESQEGLKQTYAKLRGLQAPPSAQ